MKTKNRTTRYSPNMDDMKFRIEQFRMTCEAVGVPASIQIVTNIDIGTLDEPTYVRSDKLLDTYVLYDDHPDKRTRLGNKWLREGLDNGAMLIHVPIFHYLQRYLDDHEIQVSDLPNATNVNILNYDYDTFITFLQNFDGVGHLVSLPDDTPVQPSDTGLWIVEDNELSADRTYVTFSLFPYRARRHDEKKPDTGGKIKPNGSLLKPR